MKQSKTMNFTPEPIDLSQLKPIQLSRDTVEIEGDRNLYSYRETFAGSEPQMTTNSMVEDVKPTVTLKSGKDINQPK